MGNKKKEQKARQGHKKQRSKHPDDFMQHGPLAFARFGNIIVAQNTMSPEESANFEVKLAEKYPQICAHIDEKITKIVEIISRSPPAKLLKKAFWQYVSSHMNVMSESKIGNKGVHALRMLDYVQSIIASVTPAKDQSDKLTEEAWDELNELVKSLFDLLNSDYQTALTFHKKVTYADFDQDFESYYVESQLYWCNVRGDRYLVHEAPHHQDFLSPHDGILQELFGLGTAELLIALDKIKISLSRGPIKVAEDMIKVKAGKVDDLSDMPALMDAAVKENGSGKWRDVLRGRMFGLDLFDLEKITDLPVALLDELSWEPGQDVEFFADGVYKGWPLRVWPVFKRPFIKLGGKYYCFDLYSLFDNFYRTIQRMISRINPAYKTLWNVKQQQVSEEVPFNLFKKILPDATLYKPVYYKWHPAEDHPKGWCETDGLVMYEDHLFIIEVKAGAFTYTPPATDFPAYIQSLKNLVLQPAKQGKRFLEYLKSAPTVKLYDKDHNEIGQINHEDFTKKTICAVTLDAFTEMASCSEHLKQIGVDVGDEPIWSISINDLRVYADLFKNPLFFLHYVQQRWSAFKSTAIKTNDELDHLGLYIHHNIYTKYAEELQAESPIHWFSYRAEIDKHYAHEPDGSGDKLDIKYKIEPVLIDIINKLAQQKKPGHWEVANSLLDCDSEWGKILSRFISETLYVEKELRTPKQMFTNGDFKTSIFCWQDGRIERDRNLARDRTRAVMIGFHDKKRLLIELSFDSDELLIDVDFEWVDLEGLSLQKTRQLTNKADQLKMWNIKRALLESKKIGRNDICPCGSGNKNKKCCKVGC